MSKFNGIYAAGLSILDENLTLNVSKTIKHAENLIENGCHGSCYIWQYRTSTTFIYI